MPRKLGILAGGGRLPALLIDACRAAGRPASVVAFRHHADDVELAPYAADGIDVVWRRLGNGAGVLDTLAGQGVKDVILAGSIRRPSLWQLFPDFWTFCLLVRTRALSKGDDGLLRILIDALADRGMRVVGVGDVAPSLLTPAGYLTNRVPNEDDARDIATARAAARTLGQQDVGQAAVARRGAVVASENRSGTDAMLATIRSDGDAAGVLVKCFKPQQDPRVDLPTIGLDTIEAVRRAGLRGIAIEAGYSLIVDREEAIAAANAAELFIVGLDFADD